MESTTDRRDVHFESASLWAVPCVGSVERSRQTIVTGALGDRPCLTHLVDTGYGRIGIILIPVVDLELFASPDDTLAAVLGGVELALQHGAKTVSCTGMIPAATDGLAAAQEAATKAGLTRSSGGMRLTTGHETVSAAFVLNIERTCAVADRSLSNEHVAFIGLGRIGSAVMELLFAVGYRPASVRLVDLESKELTLLEMRDRLREHFGYEGPLQVVPVGGDGQLPASLLSETTFIISATSTPDIIEIDRLQPGTICVDDSFPLGFDPQKAIRRVEDEGDIVITIAGGLAGPRPVTVPTGYRTGEPLLDDLAKLMMQVANVDDHSLTGCVYSSVLVPHFDLPVALGHVRGEHALEHYRRFRAEGFQGTPTYIVNFSPQSRAFAEQGAYFLSEATLAGFRDRHGQHA